MMRGNKLRGQATCCGQQVACCRQQVACCPQHVARPRNNFVDGITSNMLRATSNMLCATCCAGVNAALERRSKAYGEFWRVLYKASYILIVIQIQRLLSNIK